MKSRWIYYIVFILVIFAFILFGNSMHLNYQENARLTFRYSIEKVFLMNLYSFGGIGLLLGLETFLRERKKPGKWKVNTKKLVVMGIPSLLASLLFFLIYCQVNFGEWFNTIYSNLYIQSGLFVQSSLVVFGYVIASSFYKYNNE